MSGAPRRSTNLCIFLGFAALALCLGCSSSSSPGGGDAGEAGEAGDGGGANTGGSATGGANPGGSSGSIGVGGKDNDCDHTECLVANTCLDHCGGTVVYTGCCACVPPAVNKNTCSN